MPKKSSNPENFGISIGGNVNTGGGSIAGRDVNNISLSVETRIENTHKLFAPIYKTIEKKSLPQKEKEKITKTVEKIEDEVNKKQPDDKRVLGLLQTILKMSPDILEVVVSTLNNPLIGLSTVARKISEKAKE